MVEVGCRLHMPGYPGFPGYFELPGTQYPPGYRLPELHSIPGYQGHRHPKYLWYPTLYATVPSPPVNNMIFEGGRGKRGYEFSSSLRLEILEVGNAPPAIQDMKALQVYRHAAMYPG